MKKNIVLIIIIILIILLSLVLILFPKKGVTNFEECIEAGNPVMESYPRQCRHNGETFVEEIKNYVSEDPEECLRIQILCVEGFKKFSDETGCGCELRLE